MNWDALGAVAELLGAIAVFITLVYLASQVRHASSQLTQSQQQARHAAARQMFLAAAQSPEITKVVTKTEQNWSAEIETEEELFARAKLSPEEITIWENYQRAWWGYFREMIANSDVMSDSQMAEVDRGIIAFYRDMPPKVYFNAMKSISSPAVNYISALIASADPASEKSLSANVRHNYE